MKSVDEILRQPAYRSEEEGGKWYRLPPEEMDVLRTTLLLCGAYNIGADILSRKRTEDSFGILIYKNGRSGDPYCVIQRRCRAFLGLPPVDALGEVIKDEEPG